MSRHRRKPRRHNILFGIELEMVGRTRQEIAHALNVEFGGFLQVQNAPDDREPDIHQNEAEFLLQYPWKGRTPAWHIVDDDSLSCDMGTNYRAEVVSSELEERHIPLVQRACKTLQIAGARTNETCGVHVHFSTDIMDGRALRRLITLIYMYEPALYRALAVPDSRKTKFCKPIHEEFAKEVISSDYDLMTVMKRWYELVGKGAKEGRMDPVRYHGLNLNPDPVRHHFELRYFPGSLEPDVVTSYLFFSLKLLRYASRARGPIALDQAMEFRSRLLSDPSLHQFELARLLGRLGFKSKKYQRARALFLKNL